MSDLNFYKNLPTENELSDIFDGSVAAPLPSDWYIVVTDIVGSTRAIQAGRYKDVNVAGGLAVIAVSNAFEDMEFPFVFGGDGVTILIPADIKDQVSDVLYDTREQVRELYDLELRVGIVPVITVRAAGHDVSLSRLRVSQYYDQAIIRGNGATYAEELVKNKFTESAYSITAKKDPNVRADFSGFTCRWKDIASPHGETISLIIKLRDETLAREELNQLNASILEKINDIFGGEEEYHPLNEENLHVTSDSEYLGREARAISGQTGGLKYLISLLKVKLESIVTRLAIHFKLGLKAFWYDVSQLKKYQILSCDFRKYDGTLKMVIACTGTARVRLEKYLEELYRAEKIYYGIHVSDRALMTCVLHASSEREVHFVDAADGGYALAARQMKQQMKAA